MSPPRRSYTHEQPLPRTFMSHRPRAKYFCLSNPWPWQHRVRVYSLHLVARVLQFLPCSKRAGQSRQVSWRWKEERSGGRVNSSDRGLRLCGGEEKENATETFFGKSIGRHLEHLAQPQWPNYEWLESHAGVNLQAFDRINDNRVTYLAFDAAIHVKKSQIMLKSGVNFVTFAQ